MTEAPTPAADPLVGTVLGERYLVQELVGEGGMGRVYLGQHKMMRKRIAIKVIHPHLLSVAEVVARFEREAIAAGHIEHPNAVAATDFGRTADGALYLIMEYVEGRRLDESIGEKKRFSVPRVVHITKQIVRALRRAHALGIVHRDVKPENVLLIERDGDPDFVKVLDFGIAKMTLSEGDGAPLTQVGMVYGTPEYMSPEQATGSQVDARADLYSVGVLMYEMLAGRRPVRGASPVELLGQHVTATVPPLAEVSPEAHVPEVLESLIRRLLAKLPEQRPATATEVLEALDGVAAPRGGGAQADLGSAPTASVASLAGIAVPGVAPPSWTEAARTFAGASALVARRAGGVVAGRARRSPLVAVGVGAGAILLAGAIAVLLSASEDEAGAGVTLAGSPPSVTANPRAPVAGESPRASVVAAPTPPTPVPAATGTSGGAAAEVALGAARTDAGDLGGALAHYRTAARLDPGVADDPRVRRDTVQALGDRRAQDAARTLVREVLRERVAGELAEAVASGRPLQRRNARALLEELVPADRWPRFLIDMQDLRSAGGCGAKKTVIARMRAAGDPRVLPALLELRGDRRGCGFLGLSDCNACLRPDLASAIQELQGRRDSGG